VAVGDERAGLEIVQAFLATGPTLREVKKFVADELAAVDAERVDGYDELEDKDEYPGWD